MIALLVGDNGSGKTWVLDRLRTAAVAGGGTVFSVACPDDDLARRASLIVADRFAQDMHHDRIGLFGEWLRSRAYRVPVIAATVNPYAVDCFAYGEVWVLHDRRAARLDQHVDADAWRGKLQAGEFWVSVGEAWVAESPHAITLDQLVDLLARNQIAPDPVTSA